MIRTALVFCTLLFSITSFLSAQTVSSTYMWGRTYDFSVSNPNPNPAVFHLFMDGNYSQHENVIHEYEQDDTYNTETYIVDDKVDLPPQTAVPWVNTNIVSSAHAAGSATANPTMSGRIVRVDQSWRPSWDHHVFLIVSFTHPDTNNPNAAPADGTITLDIDPDASLANIPSVPWANYLGQQTTTNLGTGTTTLEWDYFNLQPGEIRHVYAKVFVPDSFPGRDVRTQVGLTTFNELCNNQACAISDTRNFRVAGFPHDPNFMTVYPEGLKAQASSTQRLDYGVYFYNDGNWFAKDITLDIDIAGLTLDPSQIEITNTEYPCSFHIDPTSQHLIIEFFNANLPGKHQTVPHDYNYSQYTTFVEFSVCAPDELPNGSIDAVTEIFFDTQAGVMTAPVHTTVETAWQLGDVCDFSNDDDIPDDEGGEGDLRSAEMPDASMEIGSLSLWPNPTTGQVQIAYTVSEDNGSEVEIQVFAVNGRQMVYSRSEGFRSRGAYLTELHLENLPAGMYFVLVQQAGSRESIRMVVQ